MKISIPTQQYEVSPDDIKAVESFVSAIMPGFIKEFGGILKDSVQGWRARNFIKIILKTKELVQKSDLSQKELSGKFFVQAFEKSSMEDDNGLQDRWAALLANTSVGKFEADVKYVSILSELSGDEVKLLDAMYSELLIREQGKEYVFSSEKACQSVYGHSHHLSKVRIMVSNFYRLGICEAPAMEGISVGPGNDHPILKTTNLFTFTELGKDFLRAVRN